MLVPSIPTKKPPFDNAATGPLAAVLQYSSDQDLIVDLGCGAGPLLEAIAPLRNCIGLDGSADMLGFAAKRLKKIGSNTTLIKGDCRKIPLADDTVDFVACLGVLAYLKDHTEGLAEISRILKTGGYAVITCRSSWAENFNDPVTANALLRQTSIRSKYRQSWCGSLHGSHRLRARHS